MTWEDPLAVQVWVNRTPQMKTEVLIIHTPANSNLLGMWVSLDYCRLLTFRCLSGDVRHLSSVPGEHYAPPPTPHLPAFSLSKVDFKVRVSCVSFRYRESNGRQESRHLMFLKMEKSIIRNVAKPSSNPLLSQSIVSFRAAFDINFTVTWVGPDATLSTLKFRLEISSTPDITNTSSLIYCWTLLLGQLAFRPPPHLDSYHFYPGKRCFLSLSSELFLLQDLTKILPPP